MKHARCWLFMAAALRLPQAALAQPKKPAGGGKPAPAPSAGAPATGGAQSIDLDADAPTTPATPAPAPAGTDTPSASAGADTGTQAGGSICDIDPSACPKQADVKKLAARDVEEPIFATQQIFFLRRGRVELNPYWSFSLNDQFVTHPGPGLAVNYYVTNVLAVGLNGTVHQPFNGDSDFNFQNRRASRLAVPLNEYQMAATANFTYVPMYGKFQGFKKFIFHYDGFVLGGIGTLRTRPIAVIDPDNRKFDYDWRLAFSLGIGLRIALNRWFAITAELRDYIYFEKVENTTVATSPEKQRDSSTWFSNKDELTNNFQAQIGLSIFLPFSWEYRLPK